MPRDKLALAVFRPSSSPALIASVPSLREFVDLPVSHGFLLAWTVMVFVTVTSSMHLGDVGSDSLGVLLEVCGVVYVAASLNIIPVSGVKTVLKCL